MTRAHTVSFRNEQAAESLSHQTVGSIDAGSERCTGLLGRWVMDNSSGKPSLGLAWEASELPGSSLRQAMHASVEAVAPARLPLQSRWVMDCSSSKPKLGLAWDTKDGIANHRNAHAA